MAIRKINTYPDRILAELSRSVVHIEKTHQVLAEDMLETMYEAPGIGLAANQVGISYRIIVVDTDYELDETESNQQEPRPINPQDTLMTKTVARKNPIILINPEIVHREGKIIYKEACLSVPEYSAEIKRSEIIQVEYKNMDGLTKTIAAEGLLAIVIQHEIDHLDGKLFIDRLNPLKKEIVKKKLLNERWGRENNILDPPSTRFKKEKGF